MASPLLQLTLPSDNATGVSVSANLGLGFDQSVKAGSGFIRIYKADGTLFHTIAITDTSQVTFLAAQPARVLINPNVDLVAGTGYYILVDAGAIENLGGEDYAGISSSTALNFTTAGTAPGDTVAPLLNSTTPADNATGVAVGSNLVLTFNEAVQAGSGTIQIRKVSDNSLVSTIAVTDAVQASFSGNQLTINPATDLATSTAYYVTMAPGVVRDLANNNFAGISTPTAFNFTTAAVDNSAPILLGTYPANNETDVSVATVLTLWFSEAIKAGSGNIEIRKSSDNSLVQSIAITDPTQVSISGDEMTINSNVNLVGDTGYYVTFASGVVLDLANNAFAGMSSPTAFNFTTGTPPVLIGSSFAGNAPVYADDPHALILYFDDSVSGWTGNIEIHDASDGSVVRIISANDGSQVQWGAWVRIDPNPDLAEGKNYYITIAPGVFTDNSGNPFGGVSSPDTLAFTTIRTGTIGNDTLTGDSADNAFDGGIGLDTLIGGDGNDTYILTNFEGGETSVVLQVENSWTASWFYTGRTVSLPYSHNEIPGIVYDADILATAYDSSGNGIVDGVYLQYHSQIDWWDFNFDTSSIGANFVPGTYLDATSDYLAGHPFLQVSGNNGSSLDFGSFTVTNAVFDYSGSEPVIVSLSIRFELHTADPDGTVIHGVVNYNYAPAGVPTTDSIDEEPGGGSDTVRAAVSYALPDNVENLVLTGPYDITGTGNSLNNAVTGNEGSNTIDGAGGADAMAGGPGNDTYVVNNAGDTIVENPDEGTDTVRSSITRSLEANVENLTLTGSGNINGTGNALNNTLIGNAGTNVLTGGAGDDLYLPGTGASIVENLNAGTDTVSVSTSYTLGSNLENLILTGTANINGTGNDLDNVITGTRQFPLTAAQNVLTGGGGNDTLDGGTGLDTLIGGAGNDNYVISNYEGGQTALLVINDPTEELPGRIWSYAPANEDFTINVMDLADDGVVSKLRIFFGDSNPSWFLEFSTEDIGVGLTPGTYDWGEYGTFTVVEAVFDYSNPLDPQVVSLSVMFEADYGNPDITETGVFNYNYVPAGPALTDTIIEDAGGGTDTVLASIDYVLIAANVENLTLVGEDDLNGTGNAGNNVITGNANDNVLDGGAGADTLVGGEGDDTYVVDDPGDIVIASVGPYGNVGTDKVLSSITYVLPADVCDLTLTGSANINGTGNELGNNLTGNTGNNVLSGGLGYDQLTGGGGNDTFNIVVDPNGEKFITDFSAGAGVGDVVVLDGFALDSFGAVQAAMTQTVFGHTILNLGNGETLTFYGVAMSAFAADDFSFVNVAPSSPPPFTLPVSSAYTNTISGTRRADSLIGNGGNNRIDGKQSNDTMTGLGGDDTYLVDASGDNVIDSSGIDTVISSASSYVLASNVENLTLTGTNNHTATGNGLNNLIIASGRPDTINGGAGNDIIQAGTGACMLTGGTGNDIFAFPVAGSLKTVADFQVGEDLVDFRSLLTWYGGSNPVGDGVIAVTATAGGVLVSVKASAGGSLQSLVKLTGISVGDVDVGGDILWDA